jgi:hypothetical protein
VPPPAWPTGTTPVPRSSAIAEFDAERLLRWGGVALVVLAITFAVSTAVSRGWIGRELQLAGALSVSIAVAGAGARLRDRRPAWRHALCGAGALGAHVTVASPLLSDLAPDGVSLGATVVVALVALRLAVYVDSVWLAAVIALAGPAGWFAGADHPSPLLSALWSAAVVLLVLVIAVPRGWHAARVAALAAGYASVPYSVGEAVGPLEHVVAGAAATVLVVAWCSVPSIGDHRPGWRRAEIQLAMLVAPWATLVVATLGDLDGQRAEGLTALATAAVIAGVSWLARSRLLDAHVVSLAVSASVAASIGLGLALGESTVALGLTLQGTGLLLLAPRLGSSLRVVVYGVFLLALSALILVVRLVDAWRVDASPGADIAHTLALVALGMASVIETRRSVRLVIAVTTLALVLLWLGSLLVHLPQGQAILSVSWAAVGFALLVVGATRKVDEAGRLGLVVLGLTVGKLLTVDLSEVDPLWRAGLFLVVGLGFLRLGFLLPKLTGGGDGDQPASTSSNSS